MTGPSALLIVNYGSHELIEQNVARTALPEGSMVVIVDNPTTSEERGNISALADTEGWTLLTPDSNLGFGGGMNLAAQEAIARGARELVLLNPDAHIVEDGFARLAAALDDPRVIVAPLVQRPDGSHFSSMMEIDLFDGRIRRRADDEQYRQPRPWLSGACLALRSDLWQLIGGFDDDYFLYWEDVDFSMRALEVGARLVVDPDIVAVHSPGGTQQRRGVGKSPIYYRFNARNRLVFAAKHIEPGGRRRWVRSSPSAAWNVLQRGGRRQLLNPFRTVWPVLSGTWEGWRFLRAHRKSKRGDGA